MKTFYRQFREKSGNAPVYIFILVLPFLVFYWQAPFLSDKTIGNDYTTYSIQQQMELHYSLAHGTFPLYVPGFAGGQSSPALTLGQAYHPLSHLAAVMPGYRDGHALRWNTLFRLLSLGLAHLGLFILLMRLGLTGAFAFIISFITVYNFRMLDLFRYGASLENYTGYLFLCMALAFYYIKPSRFFGPLSIMGSTYLLICGGHPQMMYLGLLGAGISALAIPFVLGKISDEIETDRQRIVKFYTRSALCIAGGILLAAAYILPFYFDFIQGNTQRAARSYQWSLEFGSGLTGMLNSIFAPMGSEVHGAFGSSSIILLIGLLPLLYAFRRKVPGPVIALWAVVVLVFLCSLGNATPLHYYFWKYFPLAGNFRAPGRLTMLFPFLFLLIAAWLFRRPLPYLYPALIAAPLFLFFNWVWVHHLPEEKGSIIRNIKATPNWLEPAIFWIGILSLALVALYAFLWPKENQGRLRRFTGFLLVLLVVSQVSLQMRFGTWEAKQHDTKSFSQTDRQKKKDFRYHEGPGFGMETAAVTYHKQHSALDPFLAKFYRQYIYKRKQRGVYRYLAKKDVTRTVVIEGKGPGNPAAPTPDRQTGAGKDTVVLTENTFNRAVFSLETGAAGYMTFNFPYSTNWEARIDGKKTRVFRANGYMQAVYLEAGIHRVEFRYYSSAAVAGMLISCITLLLLGLYFGFRILSGKLLIISVAITLVAPVVLFIAWYASLYGGDNLETRYRWSSNKLPPAGNLAYAKKTAMSSEKWMAYAGLGVDGRNSVPFRTKKKRKGWWQVDLGSPREIGEIRIYDKTLQGQKHLPLKIYGSVRGKPTTLLKTVRQRGDSHPWRIPMDGATIRFLRIQSSKRASLEFGEIEVYAPAPPGQF